MRSAWAVLTLLAVLHADTGAAAGYPGNAIGPAVELHSTIDCGIAFEHSLSRWFCLDAMLGVDDGLDWISARVMLDRSDAALRLRPSLGLCLTGGDSTYEHPTGGSRKFVFLWPGLGLAVRFWHLSTTLDIGVGIGPSGTGLEGDGFIGLTGALMYMF
ncbi:MAG: hypothetical protein QUS11_09075 [Candidatus Fermentibacter sp.]|nr:hypothetical protein [Candidatus Fermentibacter sp.]